MSDTIVAKAKERELPDRVSSFKKRLEELAEKVGVPRDRIPVEKKEKNISQCRRDLATYFDKIFLKKFLIVANGLQLYLLDCP